MDEGKGDLVAEYACPLYRRLMRDTLTGGSIVFVHGLRGHSIETWESKGGKVWPRDMLPSDIPSARIMTVRVYEPEDDSTN